MKPLHQNSVWLVAAENGSIPGGKVGGVGDVIRDLPRALASQGWNVRVITPAYGRLHRQPDAVKLRRVRVEFGGRRRYAELWRLPSASARSESPGAESSGVENLVIAHPLLDPRGDGQIYHADGSHEPFATDAGKFAFFNAVVAALVNSDPSPPAVLHLHDWHAGLLPALRAVADAGSALAGVRMIFTIHNLAYQGIRPLHEHASSLAAWFPQAQLPMASLRDPRYRDCINFMACAIRSADGLSTVSPTYAREILRPSDPQHGFMGGEGLEKDLQQAAAQHRLVGILNGCEYSGTPESAIAWDELRSALKSFRQMARAGDPALAWLESGKRPRHLLTSVGRLVQQKLALLLHPVPGYATALEAVLAELGEDSLLVLLGSGDTGLHARLAEIAAAKGNLLFLCGYAEDLSDLIYRSGDLFLMPSSFEPCGISQMLAMRAGQPCVVHGVGGLRDTVTEGATGFVFEGSTPALQAEALVATVRRALHLRSNNPADWRAMRRAAAAQRFSWSAAAKRYIEALYEAKITAPREHGPNAARERAGSGVMDEPDRFPSMLGELDLHLLGEGSHTDIYRKLGAHVCSNLGVAGTRFAVWAPNASRVSVVGDFNGWDGRLHRMRLHPANGIWELFIPGIAAGSLYKFELADAAGRLLPLKSDPLGQYFEAPPGNASVVEQSDYRWHDGGWMEQRRSINDLDKPMCIYEVHLGSWRRQAESNRPLTYREQARQLVDYVRDMGFTHVEFLPLTEHPFEGSWGYQPIGLFAPTQRFGSADDLRFLVDQLHQAGIGVIMDWVAAHFPRDEHGLARFDGTALYEHDDPRRGEHADWGTLIFNYGRREVANYLLGSALYWIREFHVDALRVDAVASMLYLDYSRQPGEWLPNALGGNENLEAVAFLKTLNQQVHAVGARSHAEESTAWPGVSRPVEHGGLGFSCKWNMGWMNDTLAYMREDPVHRKYHHHKMTFGPVYAFSENFILPLSHDEVVHGKGSLVGRMPGDDWQRFANLRAYFGFMYAHPGKKLLFMGGEFAQWREWDHQRSLDWHLLEHAPHRGMQALIRRLNHCYRGLPALYEQDFEPAGFEWIESDDAEHSIYSWLRRARDGGFILCVCNFTPVVRHGYRLGVPRSGAWRVLLNTDAGEFGGSGVDVAENTINTLESQDTPAQGRPQSVQLTLPPLATLWLAPEPGES